MWSHDVMMYICLQRQTMRLGNQQMIIKNIVFLYINYLVFMYVNIIIVSQQKQKIHTLENKRIDKQPTITLWSKIYWSYIF